MVRLLLVVMLAATVAACDVNIVCVNGVCTNQGGPTINGSGTVATQSRPVEKFKAIRLASGGRVIVERGQIEAVTVTTDDNLQPLIVTEVKAGVLHLSVAENKSISASELVYRVTFRDLARIEIAGAGSLEATGLESPALSVTMSGAGSVKLGGRAEDLKISISGAGDCDAAGLQVRRAKVTISGVGSAEVNATEDLDAEVSGVGSVRYQGSPKLTTEMSGVGSIRRSTRTPT